MQMDTGFGWQMYGLLATNFLKVKDKGGYFFMELKYILFFHQLSKSKHRIGNKSIDSRTNERTDDWLRFGLICKWMKNKHDFKILIYKYDELESIN